MDLAVGKKFDHFCLDVEVERDESIPIPNVIDITVGNAIYTVSVKFTLVVGDLEVDQWKNMKFGSNSGSVWKGKLQLLVLITI